MNKVKIFILLFSFLYCHIPHSYALNEVYDDYLIRNNIQLSDDLLSKSVVDLRLIDDSSIAVGTSGGIGLISDGINFYSFTGDNISEGGNPALETYPEENLIVLSGVETINYNGEDVVSGTGISWSLDNGDSWNYISQPQDTPPDCENLGCVNPLNSPEECECSPAASGCSWDVPTGTCNYINENYIIFQWGGQGLSSLPIQTTAKNVTYDLSVDLELGYIYAASWAGMLRRFNYTDDSPSWELVPLPLDNQTQVECGNYPSDYIYNPVDPIISGNLNSGGNHNHKGFSVYADFYNNTNYIWAGTADGINKGVVDQSGCIDWTHYNSSNGLSGDWIIDIVPQDIGNDIPRIWLISWNRDGGPSPHGLTYTDDNGETWNQINQFIDEEAIVYNLYFKNDNMYASTSQGLYNASINNIETWTKINFPIQILESLDNFEKIYTCIETDEYFFIGSPNGLVYVINSIFEESNLWEVYIPNDQSQLSNNKLLIWPNPFLIGQHYNVDFAYKTSSQYGIMSIYDFSMNEVISFSCNNYNSNYENLECSWNGRNKNNIRVSNGVYFCKLSIDKNNIWEKLMVINMQKGDY